MAETKFLRNKVTGQRFAVDSGKLVPAPDITSAEAFLVGAGERFTQLGRGIQNLVADTETAERLAQDARADATALEGLELSNPTARTLGNLAPDIIAGLGVGGIVGTAGIRTIAATEGFLSATLGGFTFNPDVSQQRFQALQQGIIGGAAGGILAAAGSIGVRVAQSIKQGNAARVSRAGSADLELQTVQRDSAFNDLGNESGFTTDELRAIANDADPLSTTSSGNPMQQQSVAYGDELGFSFTRGGRTGNKSVQGIEAGLRSNPWTSKPFDKMDESNTILMNKYFAQSAGIKVDSAGRMSEANIAHAFQQSNRDFDALAGEIGGFQVDQKYMADMGDIMQRNSEAMTIVPEEATEKLAAAALEKSTWTGQEYVTERSRLVHRMRQMSNGAAPNPNAVEGIQDIISALDNQVERALQARGRENVTQFYRDTRRKYRNLALMTGKRLVDADGNIFAGRAYNAVYRDRPYEMQQGRVFLPDATQTWGIHTDDVDMMKALQVMNSTAMKESVGNSGTATRLAVSEALRNPLTTIARAGIGTLSGRGLVNSTADGGAGALTTALSEAVLSGRSGGAAVSGALAQSLAGSVQVGTGERSVQRQ